MPFCASCGAEMNGQFCGRCGQRAGASVAGGAGPSAAAGLTENVAGLLCYILGFVTGIVFLVLEPYNKNRFVRFHAFQSIFLSVAWFAVLVVQGIVNSIAISISWSLLSLFGAIWTVIGLGFLAVVIICMVKAGQGQRFKVPILGDLAEKQV